MSDFVEELDAEVKAAEAAEQQAVSGATSHDDVSTDGQHVTDDSTGDIDSTPPGTGSDSDVRMVPRRALEDEREKRQYERQLREGLERRLADIEGRIAATQGKAAQVDSEPTVDYDQIFEDPKSVFERHSAAIERKLGSQRMEASREMARAQFDDYDETIEKLQTMQVPGIEDAVAKSASPAHTAYRMVKQHERDMQARQSSPEVTELKNQLEQAQRELAAIRGEVSRPPRSIAQARGTSPGTAASVRTTDDVLTAAWDKKGW